MTILIAEDERHAATRLESMIREMMLDIESISIVSSVAGAVKWLQNHPCADLLFFDIHLGDGLSFEILEQIKVKSPIIFTTAYDQYAIEAFKHNSLDYLLKPIDQNDLKRAIDKYQNQQPLTASQTVIPNMHEWLKIMQQLQKPAYKDRFIVKIGSHIKIIQQSKVLYFFSFQKGTYLRTIDGRNHLIENTIEWIEQMVDPACFFRINRKYVIALTHIDDIITESSSRLKIKMPQQEEDDLIVARERVKEFREWIDGVNH